MKIKQRELTLTAVALAAILTAITWKMHDNRDEQWEANRIEIEKTRLQIRQYEAAIKKQAEWKGELDKLQSGLRVFDINQRSVSPQLMKTIKALSGKHNLDITRSQPFDEKPTGNLFELGINCTWQGSLEAIVGFLTELQNQRVSYDIRQLSITPTGKEGGMLKGNMVIHCAYTRAELSPAELAEAEEE